MREKKDQRQEKEEETARKAGPGKLIKEEAARRTDEKGSTIGRGIG